MKKGGLEEEEDDMNSSRNNKKKARTSRWTSKGEQQEREGQGPIKKEEEDEMICRSNLTSVKLEREGCRSGGWSRCRAEAEGDDHRDHGGAEDDPSGGTASGSVVGHP